jgi:hypothetical protein
LTKIKRFFDQVLNKVQLEGDCPFYLSWSHGDFSTQHVLVANNRSTPVLIDWERAGYRSAMYDLYDAFFKRLRQVGRADSEMVSTMRKAIRQFRLLLEREAPANFHSLIASLDAAELYRLIYSAEKVCKSIGSNMTDLKLDRIMAYIDVFACYEKQLLDISGEDIAVSH